MGSRVYRAVVRTARMAFACATLVAWAPHPAQVTAPPLAHPRTWSRQEIALYAQELKLASVFKSSTDPTQFADRVCVDVLAA